MDKFAEFNPEFPYMLPKVNLEGWMLDRKQVEELAKHLESQGWQMDARGDIDCVDQGAAMAAEVVRKVLLPMLPLSPKE